MKFIHMIAVSLLFLLGFLFHVATAAAHITTTYYAYQIAGWFWAAVTLFTPPISIIYWAIAGWYGTGYFLNIFMLMIIGVLILYALRVLLAMIAASTDR